MTLTAVSLFSGAGGGDLGLEAAGIKTVALCEIEPHARAVLRKHWPDVPLFSDVCEVRGAELPPHDLLVFGAPCQDLSIAGKRAGMAEGSGTRSSLFFEAIRIWKECPSTPYCLYENVVGALSSNNGRDFAAVLSAIVGAAVPVPADGWESAGVAAGPTGVASWRILDAQWFGVPQRRRRVFVLGARAGGVDPAQVLLDGDGVCGNPAPSGETWEGVAADAGRGASGGGRGLTYAMDAECNPSVEKIGALNTGSASGGGRPTVVLPAVAVNISNGVASLDAVMGTLDSDGASTTAIGNQTRGVVMTYDARGNGDGDVVNTLAGDHANRVTDYTPVVVRQPDATTQYGEVAGALTARADGSPCADRSPNVVLAFHATQDPISGPVSPALGANAQIGALVMRQREGKDGGGKGPLLSEDKSLTLGTSNDQVVFPTQATFRMVAFGEYADDGTASAMKARDYKDATDLALSAGRPRRLMPTECEALMGWPRNHMAHGVDEKGREYALADTPRYRLAGNGIASPVIQWIGERLRQAVEGQP